MRRSPCCVGETTVMLRVTAAASADNYVALGDSYSSGTGTRDYSLNSGCQRGPFAYPALIKADRPNTTLTFVACSGAKTTDVLANQSEAAFKFDTGPWKHNAVAGVEACQEGQRKAARRTGRDDHAVGGDLDAVSVLIMARDALTQRRHA